MKLKISRGLWFAVYLFSMTPALADDDLARLMIPPIKSKQLSGFSIKTLTVPIQTEEVDHETKFFVVISGTYNRDDWNLIEGSKKINPAPNGEFQFKFFIFDQKQMIDLTAIGPKGDVEKEKINVYVDSWTQIQQKLHPPAPVAKSYSLIPSLGLSYIDYAQTLVPTLIETAITLKVSYHRKIFKNNPLWDIGLSGFFTALPLTTNIPSTYLRFLGINARVGYQFQKITDPWKLVLFGGLYYATSFSSIPTGAQDFGYGNLLGWQLYPTLSYTFKNGSSASVYFKFSPVDDEQVIISSLSNHEIAFGAAYGFSLKNLHTLSVSLDFADLHIAAQSGSAQTIDSISSSLSVGYNL